MTQQPPNSFTRHSDIRLRVLETECHVSDVWDPSGPDPQPAVESFVAIWDTGATNSVISQKVVEACQLTPVGTTTVHHSQGVEEGVPVFLINIILPNNVQFRGLPVNLGRLSGEAEVLIGMDIINRGDFAVTNRDDRTKFSFRIPSQADIDFVAEDARQQ